MKRTLTLRVTCALVALVVSVAQGVQAAGTAAGATIVNSVTLDFEIAGTPQQVVANPDTVTVQELIASFDHWVAFGLLVLIGGRMVKGAFVRIEALLESIEAGKLAPFSGRS